MFTQLKRQLKRLFKSKPNQWPTIQQLLPAPAGWQAVVMILDEPSAQVVPIVGWALLLCDDGRQYIKPFIADGHVAYILNEKDRVLDLLPPAGFVDVDLSIYDDLVAKLHQHDCD